eukprot:scaffold653125_cov57-Prasinocladus_malaysianus.AAC.1
MDVLSVPQAAGFLQSTILTRMMGVYCGAHTVFCIRSREPDRSRYHQRAWILQEFCSARHLIIVDEQDPSDEDVQAELSACEDPPQLLAAATEEEKAFFQKQRDEIQQQIPSCWPFWLCEGMTESTPLEDVQRFAD